MNSPADNLDLSSRSILRRPSRRSSESAILHRMEAPGGSHGKDGDGHIEGGRHPCWPYRGGTRILRDPARKRRARRAHNHSNRKWMSGFQQLLARDDRGPQLSRKRRPYDYPGIDSAWLVGGTNAKTSISPCSRTALHGSAPRMRVLPPPATRSNRGRDRYPREAWQRYNEWIGLSEAQLTSSAHAAHGSGLEPRGLQPA